MGTPYSNLSLMNRKYARTTTLTLVSLGLYTSFNIMADKSAIKAFMPCYHRFIICYIHFLKSTNFMHFY